jgi:hypothetical protein
MLTREQITHRLLNGRPLPLMGRLLADIREDGAVVPLDPDSGGELRAVPGLGPAFVMSTGGEATDRHIVRQFWDVSRGMDAGGPGIPALYGHSHAEHVGQWHDLGVRDLGDRGRSLVGRPRLMPFGLAQRMEIDRQIREGFLRSVSVGWQPGESVRRGDLDPSDSLYREPEDDGCGGPAEGMVMGTEAGPNRLVECSFTAIPADVNAQQLAGERMASRSLVALDAISEGRTARPADMDALLSVLGADPRVRAWVRRLVREEEGAPMPARSQPDTDTSPPRLWWGSPNASEEEPACP